MIDTEGFKSWIMEKGFSNRVNSDIVSRMKRADIIKPWSNEETYSFYLEREAAFQELSVSVRSQIRKAVRLYDEYQRLIDKESS